MDQVCMTGQPVKVGLHGIRFISNNFSPMAKRLSLLTHTDVTCSLSSGHFFPISSSFVSKEGFVFGFFFLIKQVKARRRQQNTSYSLLQYDYEVSLSLKGCPTQRCVFQTSSHQPLRHICKPTSKKSRKFQSELKI